MIAAGRRSPRKRSGLQLNRDALACNFAGATYRAFARSISPDRERDEQKIENIRQRVQVNHFAKDASLSINEGSQSALVAAKPSGPGAVAHCQSGDEQFASHLLGMSPTTHWASVTSESRTTRVKVTNVRLRAGKTPPLKHGLTSRKVSSPHGEFEFTRGTRVATQSDLPIFCVAQTRGRFASHAHHRRNRGHAL